MKKVLILAAIIAVLSIMFCGCSDNSASTIETNSVIAEEEVTFEEEMDSEPVIEEPAVDVDWQTLTYQWTDNSGYTFEATVKVSPWINTKNEAYVNAAWDEVGHGNSLPSADTSSWRLEWTGDCYQVFDNGGFGFEPVKNITDYYYCVGEVSVRNLTEGWDITGSSPITSNTIWLSACQPKPDSKESRTDIYNMSSTVSKIYCGNTQNTSVTWAKANPKYTSNQWGPASFIFAHFDNKTPNTPNGEYISDIADTYFCIDNSAAIWLKSELTTTKLSIVEE